MRRLSGACCALLALLAVALASPAWACTPTEQWSWNGPSEDPLFPEPCITPLVVQLTDDNGDGEVTPADSPDVVFIHADGFGAGRLSALDGATGTEHFTITDPPLMPGSLAAGDLDGDGVVELVAVSELGFQFEVFENDGSFKLESPFTGLALDPGEALSIADLDHDGNPEIFSGASVYASDGSFLWQGLLGEGDDGLFSVRISHAADLDPDSPGLELLAGNTLYDATGVVLWQSAGVPDGWTAVADFDLDGDPEVVLATTSELYLLDHLGNRLTATPFVIDGDRLTQPVVADVDGDGVPEVIVGQGSSDAPPGDPSNVLKALSWDGTAFTTLWDLPVFDPTRIAGASAFDMDGDGAYDIVYHDQENWYIVDGPSGAATAQTPFVSSTGTELPVVADIDGDCVTEILISGCQGRIQPPSPNALVAYECVGAPPARPLWNQLGYHVTNVEDDGGIPVVEQPSWVTLNTWLAQIAEGPTASAPDQLVCNGDDATLDGSASSGCAPGSVEYRWLEDGLPVCDWSTDPVCVVSPAVSTDYTLEVRCSASAACSASTLVRVDVVPVPQADAGPDLTVFVGDPAILDASGSLDPGCPGGLLYEWRQGAAVVRPASTDPSWSAPTASAGTTVYTVVVSCADPPACESADDVVLTVDPDLAVEFASVSAVWELSHDPPRVAVSWTTASEIDTVVFRVERGTSRSGPFEELSGMVWPRGAWHDYRFVDTGAEGGSQPWYRVVEYDLDGRVSPSTPFQVTGGDTRGSGRRHRSRALRSR